MAFTDLEIEAIKIAIRSGKFAAREASQSNGAFSGSWSAALVLGYNKGGLLHDYFMLGFENERKELEKIGYKAA